MDGIIRSSGSFICSFCFKMFQSKWNTKRHINMVHNYGTHISKHDDTKKKWVTKDCQDQADFLEIQCR